MRPFSKPAFKELFETAVTNNHSDFFGGIALAVNTLAEIQNNCILELTDLMQLAIKPAILKVSWGALISPGSSLPPLLLIQNLQPKAL